MLPVISSICVFIAPVSLGAGERQLIFDRQFGTNWVLLVTEKFQTDKGSPATSSSPQQHQTTGDLFRDTKYCLYLTNRLAKTATLLWQRSFASAPKMKAAINPREYDEHWKPNVTGVYVDPEQKKSAIVYSAEYSVWGDVVTFEEASLLAATPPQSALIFRPTPLNYTWPIASTRILPEIDTQHIKVEFAFRERETAEYVYTGVAWESAEKRERPNSTQQAVPKKVRLSSTNEVIELEERDGGNRVVFSYTGIPEAEGWQMVSNAVAGTKTVPQYPFDRKYRLYVRTGDSPPKETVLWERPFTCESFYAATGKEQPATYMKLLCYHTDPSFQRAIVFFKIMNTVFGEVYLPGARSATNVAGTKPFMAVRELGWGSPPIASVKVTPGNVVGTYSAALTLEAGGVTNIVFDGQKWIPDRIHFK